MHKIIKLTLLMLLAITLTACDSASASEGRSNDSDPPDTPNGGFILTATVTGFEYDRLMVDVTEGEYANGIYSVIIAEDAEIADADGRALPLTDINIGDTVYITYNGQTMLSYPPQIVARKIVIK